MKNFCTIFPAIGFLLLISSFPAKAQYADLLDFNDFNGIYPVGDLTLSGTVLYGMTPYGGAYDYGCIFSLDTNGSRYKDLHDFNDTNGAIPYGSLIRSGGLLFGLTWSGGTYDSGCIFSIDTNGSGYKILHYFTDTNGAFPHGSLILSGNTLYGMTSEGGKHDSGCIFSIDINGSGYKDLYDFSDTNSYPYGSLILSGGKLFGMTSFGEHDTLVLSGDSMIHDSGSIFSIDTNGSSYKVLYSFKEPNGAYPWGSLMLLKDKLYGMTSLGTSIHEGCIFSIDTNGSGYDILYAFNGLNGAFPHGSLIYGTTDLLYGMTGKGGAHDSGCVFTIDTNGGSYKDLLDFNNRNGANPFGSLTISGNVLYGMTEYGGTNNIGRVFKIDTNNNRFAAIKELTKTSTTINVYPNPSNGIFTIVIASEAKQSLGTIEIYNVLGEKVYSTPSTPSPNGEGWVRVINLTGQPSGVYFYRVVGDNGELVGEGKLIIQ